MNYSGKRSIEAIEQQEYVGLGSNGPASKRMKTSNRPVGFGTPMDISIDSSRDDTVSGDPPLTAKFSISAYRDRDGKVDSIQKGEFLFGVSVDKGDPSTQNIIKVYSLTQLNEVLAETHIRSALEIQKMRMGSAILADDVSADSGHLRDPELDILQRLLKNNPMTPSRFARLITYLGPVVSPGSQNATYANAAGVDGGLRMFVLEQRGEVETANIWRAAEGEHVGFIVKKFQNPEAFRNVNANNVMEKLQPLQVYPCISNLRRGLTHGRRLARSTLAGEQILSRQDMLDGGITLEDLRERLWTSGERAVDWQERDPRTVDGMYVDYKVEALVYPDGTKQLVGNTELCAGLYIHVGQIRKRLGPCPYVEQINDAVLGNTAVLPQGTPEQMSAWATYIGLLNNNRVTVQIHGTHEHVYTPDGRPF